MGCGEGLAKILLIIANLAFVIISIALLALGVVGRIKIDQVSEGIPDEVISTGVFNFLIAVGVVIFFIAFLGCCGACQKNIFMINSYGTILVLLFLVQVGLGTYTLIQIKDNEGLQETITKHIKTLVDAYYTDADDKATMDFIQTTLKCCGARGASDYIIELSTPPSSCFDQENLLPFGRGCGYAVYEILITSARILAIVVLSVSAVEVVGAVLAFGLAYCIKDKRRAF